MIFLSDTSTPPAEIVCRVSKGQHDSERVSERVLGDL